MNTTLLKFCTASALAACVTSNAFAAGAVTFENFDSFSNQLSASGGSLIASGFVGGKSTMADNPGLKFSAWAHQGAFWNFELTGGPATVKVRAETIAGQLSPGLTVWASGANAFDGGTTNFPGETTTAPVPFNTPHTFNAFGAQGDNGTLWMQDGNGGNMLETLAYVVSGPNAYNSMQTGWGETINTGINDISVSNLFENGVSGSTGTGFAELVFTDLAAGWYTVYTGGTNHLDSGGLYNLSVSAVPVPGAIWLMGSALLGLVGWARRNKATA